MTLPLFLLAAVFEIGGCYALFLAIRHGIAWLWLPGIASLVAFGVSLAYVDTEAAGRTFAVYGGIYIAASLLFMLGVEKVRLDRWDMLGGAICLVGAAVVFLGPRGA